MTVSHNEKQPVITAEQPDSVTWINNKAILSKTGGFNAVGKD